MLQPWIRASTGTLGVLSVCLPGQKVSANCPVMTSCATCDSRTINCAILNRSVVVGKAPGQRVARIVNPLDDFDEFAAEEIHEAHKIREFGERSLTPMFRRTPFLCVSLKSEDDEQILASTGSP